MNAGKVAYTTIVQIAGKFLGFLISTISLVVLATHLGTDGIGQYTIITTFVTFFVTLADFGISAIMTRETAQNPDRREEITGHFLGFRIIYGLAILALAPLISVLIPQYRGLITEGVILAAVAQLILLVNQIFVGVLQIEVRLDRAIFAELINRGSLLVLIVIAGRYAPSPTVFLFWVLWATCLSAVLNALIAYLFARRQWLIRPLFDRKRWPQMLLLVLPMGLFSTLSIIHFNADTFILSLLKTHHDVGIYGYAYNIFRVIFIIPLLFVGVVFPRISSLWAENQIQFRIFCQKVFTCIGLISFPLVAVVFTLAPLLTVILSRQSLADGLLAGRVLMILSLAILPWSFQGFYQDLLLAAAAQQKLIRNIIIASIINVIFNLIFIPHYSYMAAAYMTLLTEMVMLLLTAKLCAQALDFRARFNGFSLITVATLSMAVALFMLRKILVPNVTDFAGQALGGQALTLGLLALLGMTVYLVILLLPGKRSPLRELVVSLQKS